MDNVKLDSLYRWFKSYAKKFYSKDEEIHKNIVLKEEHTLRVCRNIEDIGRSIGLEGESLVLAEAIGLLHDAGRFEQFTKYKIYKDMKSEDHAVIGLRVIEKQGLLKGLADDEREIIIKSVKYHNICDLPEDEDEKVLLYSRLIRDADKLDSLDIVVCYHEEQENHSNAALEDYSKSDDISKEIIEDVLSGRNVEYGKVRTMNDSRLTFLAWMFDVNFKYTLERMKEKEYVERIINLLPDNEDIRKIHMFMDHYIEERLRFS